MTNSRSHVLIRSTAAAALGALVLSFLSPGPADADSRVPVFGDLPEGLSTIQAACDGDGEPTGALEPAADAHLTADRSSPLHDDNLRITADPDRVVGLSIDLPSSADLATLRISAWLTPAMRVSLLTADGWRPAVPVSSTARTEPWGWYDFDGDGVAPADLGPVTAFLWFGTCNHAGSSVQVDALAVGPVGDVTTYDFERGAVVLSMLGASRALGRPRWSLNCGLLAPESYDPFVPVVGAPVTLESRPHGRGEFRVLGVARTSKHGQALYRDRPRTTTDYRCRYAGADGSTGPPYPAAASEIAVLRVPTYLTIRARRSHDGRRVLVTGAADPRHPGTKVALHARRVSWEFGRSRVIDRGRLSKRGTYELSAPLRAGVWEIYVSVAKAPGNAAGPSVSRFVE